MAAGQFFAGVSGAITGDDNLQYVIPSEGSAMYEKAMCVFYSAPNKDAAIQFMQFMLRPEIAVMNTNQQFNGSVNKIDGKPIFAVNVNSSISEAKSKLARKVLEIDK